MRKFGEPLIDQFQEMIDQFFEDMVLAPWGCGSPNPFERAQIMDLTDHYEIRIVTRGIDPHTIEVETRGQRVTVRASEGSAGNIESAFTFPEAIETEAASARWSGEMLIVVVPKHRVRRILPRNA